MEMHQVRYFLAVARVLNFTRAAEECNVAQPSLTRAIKHLEEEFGGELFRRERKLTHLSDLGHRMLPVMQQCFDSALAAKKLAQSIHSGAVAPLAIGLSIAVDIAVLIPFLADLVRAFPGLELRFHRGNGVEVAAWLKKGEIEVAVAGPLGDDWDRLDSWPLFTEPYVLAVEKSHRFASQNGAIPPEELGHERLLGRDYCEHTKELEEFFESNAARPKVYHSVGSDDDLAELLEANFGIGIAPRSCFSGDAVERLDLKGFDQTRTVSVYGVAGRQRSSAANMLIKMLRTADWPAMGYARSAGDTASAGQN